MQSHFQSPAVFLTICTIFCAVIVGPEGYLRGSFCPLNNIFTLVPPTSITKTFGAFATCGVFPGAAVFAGAVVLADGAAFSDFPALMLTLRISTPEAISFPRFCQANSAANRLSSVPNFGTNAGRQPSPSGFSAAGPAKPVPG